MAKQSSKPKSVKAASKPAQAKSRPHPAAGKKVVANGSYHSERK